MESPLESAAESFRFSSTFGWFYHLIEVIFPPPRSQSASDLRWVYHSFHVVTPGKGTIVMWVDVVDAAVLYKCCDDVYRPNPWEWTLKQVLFVVCIK